uniref:DNA-directed DNA polymerase family A palm domain-containing protein n=1 Tax=Scylla olivacea TaxID=85551 RepID=A0A0P4WGC6_SCYOL
MEPPERRESHTTMSTVMQRQLSVILTPAKQPPPRGAVPELSSLGQLILASLTSATPPPPQPLRRVDPNTYYREVYMRQFRAEPEAQAGCTQPYLSQTEADRDQSDYGTSLGPLPHAPVGKIMERTISDLNNSVFRLEVDVGEQNDADHDVQQDPSSFPNMDSQDWGGVERNYLVSRNHTSPQEREVFVNKTGLSSLQSNMCKSSKMLAPRVLNKVIFSQNSCVQNPHNEVIAKSVKFCSPSTAALVVSDTHPADLIDHNELDAVDPHLFDLSLSPILDLPPYEGENTISLQAQLNNNATVLTEVTSCPETANESENIIPFSDQESNARAEVALNISITKEITSDPHYLQNQQNLYPGEGEIITHEEIDQKDLVDLEKNKVTFVSSSNATLYTDNQRSPTEEQNYRLLNAAVGENSKSLEENTELGGLCSMNENMSMPNILTAIISHVKAIDAKQEEELPAANKHTDSDVKAHPLTMESVNKLNGDTNGIIEHESESSEKSANTNLEVQKAWNESVDIFDKNTDVTLQNKTQECKNKEKLCAEMKDMALKSKDVEAINESAIIFYTTCDATQYTEFTGEEQKNITHNKVSDKSEISHNTDTRSQIIRSLEHIRAQDRFMTPKKPTFRAPYKIVSESPITGYPLDRRNITSTPKETQQKKILRYSSGYSSDTSDGIRNTSDFKSKHFTTNGDTSPGEQYPALCLNLVDKKPEFKPKFISKLSSFKFSVDYMKKKQNDGQLYLKEKKSFEATKHLSSKSKITIQESLNLSESSTVKPDICKTTGFIHSKVKLKSDSSFTKITDELESSKSDVIQEINVCATTSKKAANMADSGDAYHNTADKYARKLDKFRFNKDQSVSPAVSGDIPVTKKSCSFQISLEASEKVNSHVKVKGLAKRKKENQEHVTVRKRNKNITESHSPCWPNDDSKKTRKRKSSSYSKNLSESLLAKKSKDAKECLSSCKNESEGKSDKNYSVLKDCSQGSANLPQMLGNEAQLLAVSKYLTSAQEFCITLLYRDNSSQLRERVSGGRKQHPGSGQVTGFALRATWAADSAPPHNLLPTGHSGVLTECHGESLSQEGGNGRTSCLSNNKISAVYKVSLGINFNKEEIRSVVNCIMNSEACKIGFDAQESITFLVEKLEIDHREVISSWVILDPKIGGWLMNSDHPPITFQQTAIALKVSLPQAEVGKRPEEEISKDMEALSLVAAVLHARLVQLSLWTIFLHLEMRITPILAVMELRDIRVDRAILKQIGQRLKLKIEEVERRCHQVSGSVFNVASHAQLRSVLYQELKLDVKAGVAVPRTTKGQKSTCEAALGRLRDLHPLPGLVLQHRLLNKLKTTYVDGILACLHGSCVRAAW